MFFLPANYRHPPFRRGVADMLGVATGISAWGLMTGVAMVKSGMSTVEALLMALIVYAGSSQLAAIPLLLAGAPAAVVFSAHMRPYVMHLPRWQRMVSGYFIADLTYVLLVKRYPHAAADAPGQHEQMAYLAGSAAINWVGWTSCSLLGVVLAHSIPAHWGLGFAGILALVGMLCSLASSRLRWVSAGIAGVAAVVAFALPLKLNILAAIVVAVAACLLLERLRAPPAPGGGAAKGAQ